MQHENVDKDPDLRKRIDVEEETEGLPPKPTWRQSRLARWGGVALGALIGIALVVLAGWFAVEVFGWTPGNNANSDKAAAAGAWASAVGATALALASVWLAMQANKQARKAEESAKTEAEKTERRHQDQMDAAEEHHARELEAANARADRQVRSAQRRETVRAVEAVGQAINRITEPSAMLTQRIDELSKGLPESSEQIVNDIYIVWALRVFDIKFAISNAKMVVDEDNLRSQLMGMAADISQLQQLGSSIKEAAIKHHLANMNGPFTDDLIEIIDKQEKLSVATWQAFQPAPIKTQS